ncbi:hypothetical protein ACP70R_004218 [Stipagrostis hirtigluma subsp. patula]
MHVSSVLCSRVQHSYMASLFCSYSVQRPCTGSLPRRRSRHLLIQTGRAIAAAKRAPHEIDRHLLTRKAPSPLKSSSSAHPRPSSIDHIWELVCLCRGTSNVLPATNDHEKFVDRVALLQFAAPAFIEILVRSKLPCPSFSTGLISDCDVVYANRTDVHRLDSSVVAASRIRVAGNMRVNIIGRKQGSQFVYGFNGVDVQARINNGTFFENRY